jgi:hypothetical protein
LTSSARQNGFHIVALARALPLLPEPLVVGLAALEGVDADSESLEDTRMVKHPPSAAWADDALSTHSPTGMRGLGEATNLPYL